MKTREPLQRKHFRHPASPIPNVSFVYSTRCSVVKQIPQQNTGQVDEPAAPAGLPTQSAANGCRSWRDARKFINV